MRHVLVTGGGGRIGRSLRDRLPGPDLRLRLLDVSEQEPPGPAENVDVLRADLADRAAIESACAGVDAVVHLAGIATEARFDDLVRVNLDGTRVVLEAAQAAGVPKVILASSIHAAGFHAARSPGDPLPADVHQRPDTYYGWTKAAMEDLGRLFVDRFGMSVFALRIGAFNRLPRTEVDLGIWLSPDDCARLVTACVDTDATGYHVLWGVSANTRGWLSLSEARAIGYEPSDDAEVYAADCQVDEESVLSRLCGTFCDRQLGVPR